MVKLLMTVESAVARGAGRQTGHLGGVRRDDSVRIEAAAAPGGERFKPIEVARLVNGEQFRPFRRRPVGMDAPLGQAGFGQPPVDRLQPLGRLGMAAGVVIAKTAAGIEQRHETGPWRGPLPSDEMSDRLTGYDRRAAAH